MLLTSLQEIPLGIILSDILSFYTLDDAAKSCDKPPDLAEKSSQTEATGECTCSCHATPAPSSHHSQTPGGDEGKQEGSTAESPSGEEGMRGSTKSINKDGNSEGSNTETPGGENNKPEVSQKTPEEEAYDLMVNGKLI